LLIGFTVIIYILDVIFLVFQFIWFYECAINVVLLCILIFFSVAFTVLVALKTRKDSSILTNAFVLSYALYLSWSAMSSKPDDACNRFQSSNVNTVYQVLLGMVFTLITLFSISMLTKKDGEETNEIQIMNAPLVEKEETDEQLDEIHQVGKEETMSPEEAHVFPVSVATILFQVLMMFACMYYGMLLTNWGDASINDERTDVFKSNNFSYWIKISAQWVCFLIYTFSLVGPLVCPNRDWD